MPKTFTSINKQYFDGISSGDGEIIQLIYERYFGKIESFIRKNSGNTEDAKDVFQDALLTIYVKSRKADLDQLDCSFYTYLYSICRNIWLNKIRKRKAEVLKEIEDTDRVEYVDVSAVIVKKERWDLYREKFNLLGKGCKKILQLFFEKHNFKEISEKLGLGSANYAKKKKHLCKKKLTELVLKDKRFKELNDQW